MDDPSRPFPPPPHRYPSRLRPNADSDELSGAVPGLDDLDAAFEALHMSSVPFHHRQHQQLLTSAMFDASSSVLVSSRPAFCSSQIVNNAHVPFLPGSSSLDRYRLLRAQQAAAGLERSAAGELFLASHAVPSRWTDPFPVDDAGGSAHLYGRLGLPCMAPLADVLGNEQPRLRGAGGRDGVGGFSRGLPSPRCRGGAGALFHLQFLAGQDATTGEGDGDLSPLVTDVFEGDDAADVDEGGRLLLPDGYCWAGGRGRCGAVRNRSHHRYADSCLGRSDKYSSMDEVCKDVLGAAKDHSGSKLLSGMLKMATAEEVSDIFLVLKDHAVGLMVDVYGSIPFQHLMDVCNEEQRLCILQKATSDRYVFFNICCHTYGSRAVQRLVQLSTAEEGFSLLASAMRHDVVELAKDGNGHHVVQHALREFPDKFKQYLVDPIADKLVEIATDKSGCCIAQQCLDLIEHEEGFLDGIAEHALSLAQNQFGNFVVQHALDKKRAGATLKILTQLKGSHAVLSLQKYGSNVVEKCLREAKGASCIDIVQELIDSPRIADVLKDRYGNYVIQTALEVSSAQGSPVYGKLIRLIYIYLPTLQKDAYGKRVLEKVKTWENDPAYSLNDQKPRRTRPPRHFRS